MNLKKTRNFSPEEVKQLLPIEWLVSDQAIGGLSVAWLLQGKQKEFRHVYWSLVISATLTMDRPVLYQMRMKFIQDGQTTEVTGETFDSLDMLNFLVDFNPFLLNNPQVVAEHTLL